MIGAHAQSYAVSVEHILCNVFGCERFGFGGIVNSDYIRKHPYAAMTCGLACVYASDNAVKKVEATKFAEDFYFFSDMSFDDLLSFDSSEKVVDGVTIGIDYENGEKAVEDMIEKFGIVCKNE